MKTAVALRALMVPLALGIAVPLSYAASEKVITLRFTPKENVTANVPKAEGINAVRALDVIPLIDARLLSELSVVGENRERKTPRPIRARSSVAEFATSVMRQCLGEWGVRLRKGGLVLRGEITKLFVTEDQTYSTAVSMRFRLEDESGKPLWEGVVTGDAHQWGRSFEEENYNEEISDALKRTYAHLVDDPGFRKAWSGTETSATAALSAADLKSKILEMMTAGVGSEVIVGYVKGVNLAHPLNSEQIIEWKKAGISDAVLAAVVSH